MPKDKSHSYFSLDRSRASPYSRTSKNAELCGSQSMLPSVEDEGEWLDTICAICMEHPHNAVLLVCSSNEKGCRPYMCDTSYRHSNCLDQFRKTSPSIQTADVTADFSGSNNTKKQENKLTCPLCRGQISGWMVVEPARSFMNSKSRSCTLESCDFIGTYTELRKHARCEHPSLRPRETDPRRQQEWASLENERTLEDLLGLTEFGNELNDFVDSFMSNDDFLSLFLPSETEGDLGDIMDMDFLSFISQFEPECDFGDMVDMAFELEMPFTFSDMFLFPSDPYHAAVHDSPEQSYRPTTREFNRSMSQPDNSVGASRISNSNRGPPQPDNRSL